LFPATGRKKEVDENPYTDRREKTLKEYILKRVLMMIPTILGVTICVFVMMHMIPGDPIKNMMGYEYDPELEKALIVEYGLDKPLYIQYLKWLGQILQGNLGMAITSSKTVAEEIMIRLPVTLELTFLAVLFSLTFSVVAGVISATRRNTIVDYATMTGALIGISMPSFYLGILLIFLFGVTLGILPTSGFVPFWESPWGNLKSMILPTLALSSHMSAILTRLVRSGVLEVLRQEYILTARSKGVAENVVLYKHALKNAMIPVVTIIGMQVGYLLGGAIVIEKVFALPGIGSFGIDAIMQRDYPKVQGMVLMVSVMFNVINLGVDILYGFLDPRIRYTKK
jgi:peptide/nickel transport system permease protein